MSATAERRNGFPTDPHGAASRYLELGLAPIPVPLRSKKPGYDDWQHLRLTADTLDVHFPAGQPGNIGILNGAPSRNTHDVDLDCPEAVAAAPLLLPPTGWVFGRKSAPRSHWIYRTEQHLDAAQVKYRDLGNEPDNCLVELRGTGGQSIYPPSTHKDTGESIRWQSFTEPAELPLDDLQAAVRAVAACAMLARHWPEKGTRDDAAMALSGGLTRAGWDPEDVSRFCEAVAVAAGDEEAKSRGAKSERTREKQDGGKKTTGWPKLQELLGTDGTEVVGRVREWLGLTAAAQVADFTPEPAPWPDPPGEEAYHGLAGRIVQTIAPASEADPAALLVQTLVMFGNVIGRAAHFTVEADRHHGNEFVVLVGKTSKARKGTSFGHVNRLAHEAEELWATDRVQSGASSGEGIIWSCRDPIQKHERVKEKGQVRYEQVEADPGVQDKRLLVYEPEFANVLKQTERQGNTLSVILRQAWDGKDLRSLTKNSPARATGAHVSMIGHITSEELRRYLTATESANGFGNRFLWVCVDRSKPLPLGGRVDGTAWDALRAELVEALAFARAPREVRRDDGGTALWCEIYGTLSEGKPGLAGAMLARAEAHVMRLGLIYAMMDRSETIQAVHLLAALAFWEYCERSVYFVFGDELGDPVADELLRLLRSCSQGLSRNDLMNYFGRHQSSERIGRALGLLLQHHLARPERQQTGGRPAERWFATTKSQRRE